MRLLLDIDITFVVAVKINQNVLFVLRKLAVCDLVGNFSVSVLFPRINVHVIYYISSPSDRLSSNSLETQSSMIIHEGNYPWYIYCSNVNGWCFMLVVLSRYVIVGINKFVLTFYALCLANIC